MKTKPFVPPVEELCFVPPKLAFPGVVSKHLSTNQTEITKFVCYCDSEITHEGTLPSDVRCISCGRTWEVSVSAVTLVKGLDGDF